VLTGDSLAGKPGIWTSEDGLAWSSIDLKNAPDAHFDTVAAGPGGFVIGGFAGGHRPTSGGVYSIGDSTPALWQSIDGLRWTPVELPGADALHGGEVSSLYSGQRGWTAISDGDVSAAAWTSPDGENWSQAGNAGPLIPIASDGAHVLGQTYAGDSAPTLYSISSGDGTWQPLSATGGTPPPTWAGDYTATQAIVMPNGVAFLGEGPDGNVVWFAAAQGASSPPSPSPEPSLATACTLSNPAEVTLPEGLALGHGSIVTPLEDGAFLVRQDWHWRNPSFRPSDREREVYSIWNRDTGAIEHLIDHRGTVWESGYGGLNGVAVNSDWVVWSEVDEHSTVTAMNRHSGEVRSLEPAAGEPEFGFADDLVLMGDRVVWYSERVSS
jgi:hypothetical protein